jgi:hypothetical protein
VFNLTDQPVTFTGYSSVGGQPALAGPGQYGEPTTVGPGGAFVFTFGQRTVSANLHFTAGEIGQPDYAEYTATITHFEVLPDSTRCHGSGGIGSCAGISGHNAVLLPPPGATVVIDDDDPGLQSAIVNTLCRDSSNCTFFAPPQPPRPTHLPERVLGNILHNETDTVNQLTLKASKTQSHTTSIALSASVSASIKGAVTVAFQTTYSQSWTDTKLFSYSDTIPVQPGDYAWLTADIPVNRIVGEFNVRFNGVNFLVRNVYFDLPDPQGNPEWDSHTSPTPPGTTAV